MNPPESGLARETTSRQIGFFAPLCFSLRPYPSECPASSGWTGACTGASLGDANTRACGSENPAGQSTVVKELRAAVPTGLGPGWVVQRHCPWFGCRAHEPHIGPSRTGLDYI